MVNIKTALTCPSPLGPLTLWAAEDRITGLEWGSGGAARGAAILEDAAAELTRYFQGTLTSFDLPLAPPRSAAQRAWRAACLAIPFGETRTYGELGRSLGWPAQAVGQACGSNPIPILVPCHRVLAATGLGGFSGGRGIEDKVALLRHEGAASLLI